jgi:protein-disulfide isomerase
MLLMWAIVAAPYPACAQTPDTVVARIDGDSITLEDVDYVIASQLYSLQQQIYVLRKTALQNLILHKVLEREARRTGLTLDQLKQHMMAGEVSVTSEQVDNLYQQNVAAFAMMSPDEARAKLRLDLEGQSRLKKYRERLSRLRDSAAVAVFLSEPRLRLNPPGDPRASRGHDSASVVLTEFSDFQCPYCREAQTVLHRILDEYPDQVRLEFRHLPLEIHPFAFRAAEATYCAGKKAKFWEYHDALFALDKIENDTFKAIANNLGIDPSEFERCLSSDQARAAIQTDTQEAARLGINSTPTLLINGRQFRGSIDFEELKSRIEQEIRTTDSASLQKGPQPLSVKEKKK